VELYPAIDLRRGRTVRLAQGDFRRETVYGTGPVGRARTFDAAGAKWLHVVDLDASLSGVPANRQVVAQIAGAVKARVQAGGGVRSATDVEELLAAGVARAVMGTAAVAHPELLAELAARWPGQVGASVDHYQGEVRVKGWAERTGRDVASVVSELASARAAVVVVTEISRDGLMVGPDLHGYRTLLEAVDVPLIASGGVSSLDDLRRLAWLQVDHRRLAGVIVGRALYEGRFSVAEAVAALRAPEASAGGAGGATAGNADGEAL
jgi:phosphoribosylformimino-5-aminoimidazole carboxamide ribotide isomerase